MRCNRVTRKYRFAMSAIVLSLIFVLAGCQHRQAGQKAASLQNDRIDEIIGTSNHVLPDPRQIRWQEREMTAFVHYTVNTFTDREWGEGGENPEIFNPTELDTAQWVDVFKQSGIKMVILTAKHHDGFCLWPSKYTEHSIKNSPYKNGKGDIVGELSKACKAAGLEFGVYLSPWDRNHADYGKPEYITYYRNQLQELLTRYGDIAEVWFDGANGGSGYYGGANETRNIDAKTYYDWPNTWALVRRLQPNACMFSDVGPDCRWVGNEDGFSGRTCWSMLNIEGIYPGIADRGKLNTGNQDGTHWVPAECDVSIRPGWFYHTSQDSQVKSLKQLIDIYFGSVGRNGLLLLNIPPDRRGLIHENDAKRLEEFHRVLEHTFNKNLAAKATVTASNIRGQKQIYSPSNLLDNNADTVWASDNDITSAELIINLPTEKTFNVMMVQEYIKQGQRVEAFEFDVWDGKDWKTIANETTIGYKRLLRFDDITANKARLKITKANDSPILSNFGLFYMPSELLGQ